MRRQKEEITEGAAIEAILTKARIGRLATLGADGYPYIVPVNYVYWRESIYFHCAPEGEKLDNIRRHPQVCFEVDVPLAYLDTGYDKDMPPCEVSQFYQCVVIRGRGEVVDEMTEKVGALNALMAGHEGVADFTAITAETAAVARCAVVAVRVERLSAKANLAQKKSAAEKEKLRQYLEGRCLPGDLETAALIR
jgi:nitroimidazol reductase NimA-like FMN-containing flavoprotein (pyridoxamine 5'-phosphate oxidase superfamily)